MKLRMKNGKIILTTKYVNTSNQTGMTLLLGGYVCFYVLNRLRLWYIFTKLVDIICWLTS